MHAQSAAVASAIVPMSSTQACKAQSIHLVSPLPSSPAVDFFVVLEAFSFVLVLFFVASSATFFFFAAIRSKETKSALDAPFSPTEPAFMEPEVGALVAIPPTLRGDVLGDLLGVVSVYFTSTGLTPGSLLRSAQTLFARSPDVLGSFSLAFYNPRWTAVMTLRSSESGGLLGRVSYASSDVYPLDFFLAAALATF